MRRSGWIVIIIVLIVIAAVAVTLTRNSSSPSQAYQPAPKTNNNAQASNINQPTAAGKVDISDMMFTPSQINISKGDTVTWTNSDSVAHTVTADNGNGPNSSPIAPGDKYSYTFTQAGSYQYHCSIHPSMRGTIVVK